jgi:hypothetical protein
MAEGGSSAQLDRLVAHSTGQGGCVRSGDGYLEEELCGSPVALHVLGIGKLQVPPVVSMVT